MENWPSVKKVSIHISNPFHSLADTCSTHYWQGLRVWGKGGMGEGDHNELGMASVVKGLPTKRKTFIDETLTLITAT